MLYRVTLFPAKQLQREFDCQGLGKVVGVVGS